MATSSDSPDIDAFVQRWSAASGTELANYQLFVMELAGLLDVPQPEPAREDTRDNAYVFERRVTLARGDGTSSEGRIDCYRRGAFVLEAKRVRAAAGTRGFDDALLRARSQAETYARALPAGEGRPPFLLVVDVGQIIEIYAEFTRSGATYTPFPDPRSHRLRLADLARPEIRERLRTIWLDPLDLDPGRRAARVTREIAAQLADIAQALEAAGHAPKAVAAFLSRCLFSMFAEDIGLLPKRAFTDLLERYIGSPHVLAPQLETLWHAMDRGDWSPLLEAKLLQFNGKLFKDPVALPLQREQVELLLEAARADWQQVEPAIFGTLLERALHPEERHALGAHYTPRAYVERLVLPTVMEPLRADWQDAQAAALVLMGDNKAEAARKVVRDYLRRLCEVRVLDPACGSGNFLYVALEQMKRLEGEVLNFLDELGDTQGRLDLAGVSVDPHQLLGIEINPRAAEVAEMVLWIGYLQWHYRTRGNVIPPLPVLKDFHNIECRDAVLAYDRVEYVSEGSGRPITRWDGKTMKKHPVTGLDVPDETAQVPIERYVNPRAAEWPQADFVVGNPPFVGSKLMRQTLGDGYVDAIQKAWPEIPEATDFVMRWWHKAASLARAGHIRRFGLITTNSLRQTYVRRAVEPHLNGDPPLSLAFAIPNHPWVDSADGAAVRIAMTVGARGYGEGRLVEVTGERDAASDGDDDLVTDVRASTGVIHADLSVGADLTSAMPLQANLGLCSVGMKTIGKAFQIDAARAAELGLGTVAGLDQYVRPYLNGRDWVSQARGLYVIDFFGLQAEEVQRRFPAAYQHLLLQAKPERDLNRNAVFRERWWIIGHPRQQFRAATRGLGRYIVTVETQKHRLFGFLDSSVAPDSTLVTVASDRPEVLGILSSRLHVLWSLRTGGRLGVGDDPRYNKTRCFETYPFPELRPNHSAVVSSWATRIHQHRDESKRDHPELELTAVYNVLEKLRAGADLTARERVIHDHGLVSVLREIHDDLDRAVFDAYGWNDLAAELVGKPGATTPFPDKPAAQAAAEEELLARLVRLNAERAAEEARGLVRWLRPDFQAQEERPDQGEMLDDEKPATAASIAKRIRWPSELPDQIRLVADTVAKSAVPLDAEQLAAHFTGRGPWKRRLPEIVASLAALGRVRLDERDTGWRVLRA